MACKRATVRLNGPRVVRIGWVAHHVGARKDPGYSPRGGRGLLVGGQAVQTYSALLERARSGRPLRQAVRTGPAEGPAATERRREGPLSAASGWGAGRGVHGLFIGRFGPLGVSSVSKSVESCVLVV